MHSTTLLVSIFIMPVWLHFDAKSRVNIVSSKWTGHWQIGRCQVKNLVVVETVRSMPNQPTRKKTHLATSEDLPDRAEPSTTRRWQFWWGVVCNRSSTGATMAELLSAGWMADSAILLLYFSLTRSSFFRFQSKRWERSLLISAMQQWLTLSSCRLIKLSREK